jgi:glycosyltransferase involved in cell wall biosynthesis
MKLSIIIPCYNAATTVGAQLEMLARQKCAHPWEVVVADNGSTDSSAAVVAQYQDVLPALKIVDASAKRGAPFAINTGVKAATGDTLLFCDADDEVGEGWLAAMAQALEQHDFVGCRFDVTKLNPPWTLQTNPQAEGIQSIWYPPYLPHAGSGGMGIKRYLHEAIGGFDESLFILYDTDYCWRLQLLQGVKLHFVPDGVLHVRYRTTLKGIYLQARGYAEYNVLLSRRYRASGEGIRRPWQQYFHDWLYLLKLLPRVRRRKAQSRFAWQLGRQMGRLRGVLKYRVPPV